ncbi:MAG: TRAP transporter substrate-binding protein [Desulfuromonadales bacterium]|nr:TRAP transporter substrate-binding protein [Desulfuromonadales bacterium]
MKKILVVFPVLALLIVSLLTSPLLAAEKKKDPLANWKTKFDFSKAEYTYILSNISHPVIQGVANGYNFRDALWEKSNGRIYVDYRPLAQLGGEKDVIAKLRIGAVQGMLSSSVASANIADKLGIVNLPYVVDTYDKLDQFRSDPELWGPYSNSAQSAGLMVADIVNYGQYGWATTTPVRTIEEAKTVNFRIAEAPVNIDVYNAWETKFTVMPWPDVPQALQTGVINGLDHTAIVCNITKKFTIAKYFTELNYAQGLFVHLVNKRWFNKLPADLQKVFIEVLEEESVKTRALTREQHDAQIAKAKEAGVEFIQISDADKATLVKMAEPVYASWGEKIGLDYLNKVRATLK